MPLISVIMPSYNHERFIGEAIESVLGQTCEDLELIIVDDASADGSRVVIEAYGARDRRIRSFFHAANLGIAKTVNQGLDEARGEFVAFLSSDDVWVQHKLRKQLDVLRRDADLVVYSEVSVIDAEGRSARQATRTPRWPPGVIQSSRVFKDLLDGNPVPGQSMILKRGNLEGIRYDEGLKYVNDWKFILDLAGRYNFYFMSECLAKYRVHGGNTISRDAAGWLHDFGVLGQHILANYGCRLSRRTRAKFMYRIGCGLHFRGEPGGRAWMAKAIVAHPLKGEYCTGLLSSFCRREVIPRSIQRRCSQDPTDPRD